jgi:uncharacterized damage-inducible protein DinB
MTNREFFRQQCAAEFPRFIGVLEASPPEKLDYRPHPTSRSAYELIGHLLGHEQDRLQAYRAAHAALEQRLDAMTDATWESAGQFLLDGKLIYEVPKRDLAWMLLFDGVHHRGQLSTYLRPMGGKVPAIYGPSADSMPAGG